MSANFLSPNSYSFDKFNKLQDYFMNSLGYEGFQTKLSNINEYGMSVLREPFQDESTNTRGVVDKYLFKWENKNKNSLLTHDELSYTNGMPLESQYIPPSNQAEITTTTTTSTVMPPVEDTTNPTTSIMPPMKDTTTTTSSIMPPVEDTTTTTTSSQPTTKQFTKIIPNKTMYPKYMFDKYCNPKLKNTYSADKCKQITDKIEKTGTLRKESFSVDEGLNNQSSENKISTSNKKPVNKSKSETAKDNMSNRRNNNNMRNNMRNNRSVTEEDDMETTTSTKEAEMMDEDMETTTTRNATTSKKSNKAANRAVANNMEEEEETTTTEMVGSEEDEDMAMNNGTERGPDGDMESEDPMSEESIAEGFSGSRTYRFGHLSTALKALLLALLFWLLTNEAGSRYVAKLAKRLGAATCVVQVMVFFVLAYIALML